MVGLADADWTGPEPAKVFAGNPLMPGMVPYSSKYGGLQFDACACQLGSGPGHHPG